MSVHQWLNSGARYSVNQVPPVSVCRRVGNSWSDRMNRMDRMRACLTHQPPDPTKAGLTANFRQSFGGPMGPPMNACGGFSRPTYRVGRPLRGRPLEHEIEPNDWPRTECPAHRRAPLPFLLRPHPEPLRTRELHLQRALIAAAIAEAKD